MNLSPMNLSPMNLSIEKPDSLKAVKPAARKDAGVPFRNMIYGFQSETFREFPRDIIVDSLCDFVERFA